VLRFVVNAIVLGCKVGINSNARERGMTCGLIYFRRRVAAVRLYGISKLLRMKNCVVVICIGDCCALLKGVRILF